MLCWDSLPMGCNWWYLRSSLDKESGTISKMDRRKVDGDSSQSHSPEWKMRDVSFPILMFPFILFEFCKCLFVLGVACAVRGSRLGSGPFPQQMEKLCYYHSSPLHLWDFIILISPALIEASLGPVLCCCQALCIFNTLPVSACECEVITLMLIWCIIWAQRLHCVGFADCW